MTATITCPACGDTHGAPDGDADYLAQNVSRCSLCEARIVYGQLAPRVVVEPAAFDTPHGSRPALVMRIQDPVTRADVTELRLDPQHAFLLAQSIIGLVRV